MDLAPLPAPLHLRPLRIRPVPSSSAIIEMQRFLADKTATRVLSGSGASAIKEALVRLVKRLEQEQLEASSAAGAQVESNSSSSEKGKKRKVTELVSDSTKDKKRSKKHKKA
ncbi:BQ2448_520 [Microbotryum intermedium]|uniref:BQ2448_520 protein n=1 Tax=Microbotryum intermedium TaxID=269621 RepID=A0A238F6L9_9BASI|nr:BQ2448_520 [Microbotryum intermedium]